MLVQLPPSLKFDYELADYFFEELRNNYHYYDFVLEARHHSWLEDESIQLLSKHDIAFVISQSGRSFPYAEMLTSKNVYVRMHGPDKLYESIYTEEMLQELAQKIMEWQKEGHVIWVFFNNTMHGYGRVNAIRLKEILKSLI